MACRRIQNEEDKPKGFFQKFIMIVENITKTKHFSTKHPMICRTLVGVVDIGCMNYVNINNMMIFIIYEKTDKMEKCTLYGHERINK
ncbi:TPA: hypothetical protein ACQCX6_000657 [Campylobacter jejuni]